jgi:hypothetical protein
MNDDEALPPDWTKAIVTENKLRNYLLNPEKEGSHGKASVFTRLGFERATWRELGRAFLEQHAGKPFQLAGRNQFGVKYMITRPITGPVGTGVIRSIWMVRFGDDTPRLVTAYPE